MNPRLVAIDGPAKDANYPLIDGEISIGRDSSNRVCLADLALSRRHCMIKTESGQFKLVDLGSLNGSLVNGVPVKERWLQHGDRIGIGDSLFVFLLHDREAERQDPPVEIDEGQAVSESTVQLRIRDAVYLRPESALSFTSNTSRVARDLDALLRISTALHRLRDADQLQHQLLELVFEVVPAQRAAILMFGEAPDSVVSVLGRHKNSNETQPVRVSRTIVRRVASERLALLSNEVSEGGLYGSADSLITSQVQSLLCVPLEAVQRVLGALYLDTSDAGVRFDENHLQLVTAIASIAAVALENARYAGWLAVENQRLRADMGIEHNMVGESARMQEVYQWIARAAPTDSTVLIRGESGTGKELVARAIHVNSARADGAFVAINCAALTETLLESELFGHERGAFTGAIAQKKGKLEVADGGTVFLDEIAELAPMLQAKLLRVLQEREFERVGGTRPIKVDVRLIAATNKDLEEAIRTGDFRQDLYYRLNVVCLTSPPLRERQEDILLLARYFAAKYGQKCKRPVRGISAEAMACLTNYDWPGNVRELENAIERAIVLGSSEYILPEDLPEAVVEAEHAGGSPPTKYHEAVKEAKKQLILEAMQQTKGNYTEAAKLLGVHPNYLHRLIRNLNLKAFLKF